MNKKTSIASLLPVLVLVLLALGAGFFLIKDELKLPKLFDEGPSIRRISGYPSVVKATTEVEKQRRVIKSEAELVDFLKTIDPSGDSSFSEKIDFNKEYLIAASTGTVENNWVNMKVKKVYMDKKSKQILISLRQTNPDETCNPTMQQSVAFDIVAISKSDNPIDFEVIREIEKDCDKFLE